MKRAGNILICGGGATGLSAAYFLGRALHKSGRSIKVVEMDPSLHNSSTMRSAASLRQQFSLKENILMSRFSSEFFKKTLPCDFTPMPYLFLAETPEGKQVMEENYQTQSSVDPLCSKLLGPNELKEVFPQIDNSGISLSCLGDKNFEGFFDPSLFCYGLKTTAKHFGVEFQTGVIQNLTHLDDRVEATIKHSKVFVDKEEFSQVILTTGAWSLDLARRLGIQDDTFPVRARRRVIFVIHAPDYHPSMNLNALICCPNGVYVRPERIPCCFICGCAPDNDPDCDPNNFDLESKTHEDDELFHEKIWPTLATLFPTVFESIKVTNQWAGFYEYNTRDQNLLIGSFSHLPRVTIATGSSGHGIQHSPAIGRALMELTTSDSFQSIDLSRLSVARELPLFEKNIV